MNANITELMEFPCLVFSIEKSENLKKIEIVWNFEDGLKSNPVPKILLDRRKTWGLPTGPELSDRGQP